jgi:DnaJ-class molecular chaperone
MNANKTPAPGDIVTCGKCAGSGLYYFSGGRTGACYPCEGTGRVEYQAPAPARAPRPRDPEQTRIRLAGWYRAAKRGEWTLADVLDARDGAGWTMEGVDLAFSEVPGAREAFRALGWEV